MRQRRVALLAQWGHYVVDAARSGALTGRHCPISRVETIAGPRAGALEIFAGLEAGRLLKALSRNDCAVLRQFIPWSFPGSPQIFMAGRYLRLEAGWRDDMAESLIRLGELGEHPHGGGRWVAGKSETGATVIPGLNDRTPHFLISGQTGSGKSVALRSAVLQLSADSDNTLVLVDGKAGESLRAVERLPGVVGPVAVDGPGVRAALGWAVTQMRQRYEAEYHNGRLVVIFDEFQEMAGDVVVADLLRKLAAQGRAAGVHLLAATQHPTVGAFGDASTRRNLVGKVALRVDDADASGVAVGGNTPRADYLLGAGDSYTISPSACHRVQLVYVDEQEITAGENGGTSWRFSTWPEFRGEDVGQELPSKRRSITGDEMGIALVVAANGEGRPAMVERAQGFGIKIGSTFGRRLHTLAKDTSGWLNENGFAICRRSDSVADPTNVRIVANVW